MLMTDKSRILILTKELLVQYDLDCNIDVAIDSFNSGFYNPISNTIYLSKGYNSYEDFIITALHEICHALDNKRLGKKFIKKYNQASQVATHYGLNAHDHNKWEIRAEKWAKKEYYHGK